METAALLFLLLSAAVCTSALAGHYERALNLTGHMNWSAAQQLCRETYTDLVTVQSEEELNKVANVTTDEFLLWIGLRYRNDPKWSNGDNVTYRNDTPEIGQKKPYCISMSAGGLWESVNCTESKPFMCYKEGDSDQKYSLIKKPRSWCDAQRYCRSHYTDLVSIKDEMQNGAVIQAAGPQDSFWIGLMHTDREWSDGTCVTEWESGLGIGAESCVYVNKWDAKINPRSCEQPAAGICYKDQIHLIREKLSWTDARDHCIHHYEGMLRIESPEDQLLVQAELEKRGATGHVWLGLRQNCYFGFWIWANGLSVGWSNWEGGSQPQQRLSHICGAMATSGPGKFKWSDQNCFLKNYFLCEGRKRK
ncbi:hypothetical protein GJAV_G00269410 [Gymnothorax javanicus]|nr:hypothetical protein GJAV_G00269410 [Gymnothorax javanicus]